MIRLKFYGIREDTLLPLEFISELMNSNHDIGSVSLKL